MRPKNGTGVCEINAQLTEIMYLVPRPPPPSTKLKGISLARWMRQMGVYFTGLSAHRVRIRVQLCAGGKGGQKQIHFEVGRLFHKPRSQILTPFLESSLLV